MRSLLAFGITTLLASIAFTADDKKPDPQQPKVSIEPRVRGKSPEAAETVIDRKSNIRVDTTLVLIPVAVIDPMSRFVTGLDKENFKLTENGVEQEITQFSSEDAPSRSESYSTPVAAWAASSRSRGRRWRNF